MIKSLLIELFRPYHDRHYAGPKRHAISYLISYSAFLGPLLLGEIFLPNKTWLLVGLGVIILGFIHFFIFDRLLDKILWRRLNNRFSEPHAEPDQLQRAIKDYEKNPNDSNKYRVSQLVKSEN